MFVEIEDAIAARLSTRLQAATLPAQPKVGTAADLAAIKDKSQGEARVTVAYNGINSVTPLSGNAAIVTVSHEFYVWTTARSANRHGSQKGTREIADPIMLEVLQALCGWRYAAGKPALELAETPGPAYEDGFGHFPLVFTIKQQVRGTP